MLARERARCVVIECPVEVLGMRIPAWLTRNNVVKGAAALVIGGAASFLAYGLYTGHVKTGFLADEKVTKSEKRNDERELIETVTTTTVQDAKTLWEWLQLSSTLAIPVLIAVLIYQLRQRDQIRAIEQAETDRKRAEDQAVLEREIVDNNQKEEALQAYFDRLSDLLVEQNLIAIAMELNNQPEAQQDIAKREKLNAAVDVIRARTLAILRRFGKDGERKRHVIQFLIEAEVLGKLKLRLSGANLSDVFLSSANLSGANLSNVDLSGANLFGANLSGANLSSAKLSGADLRGAKLSGADLNNTDLSGANLFSAYLSGAYLSGAYLRGANLSGADLSNTDLSLANLSLAKLSDADLSLANLSLAKLSDADLSGAFLSGAYLSGAYLSGANLGSAKTLTQEQLDVAKLCKTKLPQGITLSPNRDCKALGLTES